MNIFKSLGKEINYTEILEVDGAFSTCHINYGKSPIFNGIDGKEIAVKENCYKMMLLTGAKDESTLNFYKKAGYNSTDKTAFIQWL